MRLTRWRASTLSAVLGVVLALAVSAAIGMSLWSARNQEIASWRRLLGNMSLVLAEQTSQELSSAYLILDNLVDAASARHLDTEAALRTRLGDQATFQSMRDKVAALPHIDVATIVAANGDVINFTRAFPAPLINLADRDYFRERRDNPRTGVFISAPVRNKGNGQWTFYLSRRIDGPGGEFLGVALVGLSSTFLSQFYQKISMGEGTSIALYRRDFTLLARYPHVDGQMGKANLSGASFDVIERQGLGAGVVLTDGPRFANHGLPGLRMGAPRLLDKYPVIVTITVEDKVFLSQWRSFSALLTGIALLTLLVIGIAFRVLYRAMVRRDADLRTTEQLKTDAEAASHAKSEFLAMMSHEIRTPLTAIIGFAESLDEASDRQARQQASEVIVRNGQHLLAIINDILDLSKIEAGRLYLEQVAYSPYEIASGLETVMAAQAAAKGISFQLLVEYPLPAIVIGDPTRWRQVLFNLCSNAVKFTERGSVRMTLWYDDPASMLMCSVVDTGIGMSDEQMRALFAPFAQADSATARKYGGTGLGLHLVRRLVLLMGGAVEAASELGHGALFQVAVKVRPPLDGAWLRAAPERVAAPAAVAPPLLHGKVLLAEDGVDNRMLLVAILSALGLDVVVAENGARAIELTLSHAFDLILMDIQMPVMDGIEATGVIRATGYDGPLVALTANVMAEDVKTYLASGFSHCVGKPVDRAELGALLAGLLGGPPKAGSGPSLSTLPGFAQLQMMFEERLPPQLARMQACYDQGEWKDMAMIAHTIKGSAASFGHPGVGLAAARIDAALRSGEHARAGELLAQLVASERRAGALVPDAP